jgi:heterodisulfide reductase subunit A-like polyferredoxin
MWSEPSSEAEVAEAVARQLQVARSDVQLVATSTITNALPKMDVPLNTLPPLRVEGIFMAGDHRATASIQGALASGERAARAVIAQLLAK